MCQFTWSKNIMLLVSTLKNDYAIGFMPIQRFFVTNGVRQGGILSPMLFNIYIDGLSDILNNSTIRGLIGGIRVNHMLYADDLCIISLSSAGLQQLLVQFDDYCRKHSITFNVSKSICMFFKSAVNRKCDTTDLFLSSKAIDAVQ